MRMLVTGASGHIGAFLVPRLLAAGHEVALTLRNPEVAGRLGDSLGRCHAIRSDLSDMASSAQRISDWKPEVCIHLAWFGVGPDFRFDPRQITVNVQGSLDLLKILSECGCRRFIGLGSQAEYGIVDEILVEDLPARPVTAYGSAKHALQVLSKAYCELVGMEWTWVRLISCYGPMDDEAHMIPYLIRQILSGARPAVTLGEQKWDYLYIDDVASAVETMAESRACGEVVNLGSGSTTTIRRIVETIRDLIDPAAPIGFGELPYRKDQVMRLEADIGKIRRMFGWNPSWSMADGLRETVRWYATHPRSTRV